MEVVLHGSAQPGAGSGSLLSSSRQLAYKGLYRALPFQVHPPPMEPDRAIVLQGQPGS